MAGTARGSYAHEAGDRPVAHSVRRVQDFGRHCLQPDHHVAHQDQDRVSHQSDLSRQHAQAGVWNEEREKCDRRDGVKDPKGREDGIAQGSPAVGRNAQRQGDRKARPDRDQGEGDVLPEGADEDVDVGGEPVPVDPGIHDVEKYPGPHSITVVERG